MVGHLANDLSSELTTSRNSVIADATIISRTGKNMKDVGTFALLGLVAITFGCGTVRDQNAKIDAALTHKYWSQIRTLSKPMIGDFQKLDHPQVADLAQTFNAMAKSIDTLPTTKVDPDAIVAGYTVAMSMRTLVTFSEQNLDATTWRPALLGLQEPDPSPTAHTSKE